MALASKSHYSSENTHEGSHDERVQNQDREELEENYSCVESGRKGGPSAKVHTAGRFPGGS